MLFQVVTIFPELIDAFARVGLIAKASEAGLLRIETTSPRRFAGDKHNSVDDAPFGGGSGMVMLPEPLALAMEALDASAQAAGSARCHRVLLSPHGAVFDQAAARRLSAMPGVLLICGRYEGVDDRVSELVDEHLSIGDFVLNGGETAAMAVIEAVSRLVPGMLGNAESLAEESHSAGLLEYPQYTRPADFRGLQVPEVLLSGDHARIEAWRREQSRARSSEVRS
jgi:tRNA (guanine37-N1)-methyltransferase